MWIFPLTAALVAALFAGALVRRYVGSRRPYELVWALALLMYAGASLAVAFGATIIAGFGSAFAALGYPVPFSISLLAGICVMFLGFLRAARRRDRAPVN